MTTGQKGSVQPWKADTETFHGQITISMTSITGNVAITRSMSWIGEHLPLYQYQLPRHDPEHEDESPMLSVKSLLLPGTATGQPQVALGNTRSNIRWTHTRA